MSPDPAPRWFDDAPAGASTARACRETGASYRQADYWARTGLLIPSLRVANGSGSKRRYSEHDLRVMRVVVALARMGLCRDVIGAVDVIRDLPVEHWDGYLVIDADGAAFVTNDPVPDVAAVVVPLRAYVASSGKTEGAGETVVALAQ